MRPVVLIIALLAQLAGTRPSAAAPDESRHRLTWRSDWRRFEWIDAAQTAATTAAFLYVQLQIKPGREPRWTGPILFDASVRDALVADSRDGRNRAALISHVLWYVPMVYAFVDGAVVPLASDRWNWDIAWELTAMNLQAASVDALLTRFGHRVVQRARPDSAPCREDPDYSEACTSAPNSSFPGGHASAALTAAGLICAHHSQLPLYGGGAPDVAACALALGMGFGSAAARIVADRHYVSDTIAGAMIGLGTGFGMPVLLHYHGIGNFDEASSDAIGLRWTLLPMARGDALGLSAYGWF